MSSNDRSAVVSTQFYSLAEAGSLAGVSIPDLLRMATYSLIETCVLVPAGRRAFAVDPGSLILWESQALHDRHFTRSIPDKELGMPIRKDDVTALILSFEQCQDLRNFGFSRQVLFQSGYSVAASRGMGTASDPLRVRPIRMPMFMPDARTPTDQSQWRFAIYSKATVFAFKEGAGYPEPEDLLITVDSLHVLGRELLLLPEPVELSPLDIHADSDDHASAEEATRDHQQSDRELKQSSRISDVTRSDGTAVAKPTKLSRSATPDQNLSGVEMINAEVIREDRHPIVLLPRDEVERRINKGKSWIYERINARHPRFDSDFPQPIRIGGNVGWIEEEIEDWTQRQIEINRG